jgi:hypothetical protein
LDFAKIPVSVRRASSLLGLDRVPQRLCLRATTDYWVNAMDGQPLFVVNQVVDPGLIHVIEHEIVPRPPITVDKLPEEARRVLRALYTTEADLVPDPDARTLTVRLHHCANAATDRVIEKLCQELNATETIFPRTNLRLVLKLGST